MAAKVINYPTVAQRDARAGVTPADAAVTTAGVLGEDRVLALIGGWLDLSELQRCAFIALTRELTASSDLVETSTLDLSERFQQLAAIAQAQTSHLDKVITVAKSIDVKGEAVPLETAMQSVEQVLRKVIHTILIVSKHAMRMVYALDDVDRDVQGAQQCVARIATINTQTRYLALNAAIEANRSGEAGAAFRVIANEIKDLARATDDASNLVRERISSITQGIRSGHKVLQEIATLDMSEHIMAKERLDDLIAGIMAQNRSFTAVLSDAAETSSKMSSTVGQLVTGMQFQDRTKQHLTHVIDVLAVLAEAVEATQDSTRSALPGRFQPGSIDRAWLERIVANQTLGAVKQRILAQLMGDSDGDAGGPPAAPGAAQEDDGGGDIELF